MDRDIGENNCRSMNSVKKNDADSSFAYYHPLPKIAPNISFSAHAMYVAADNVAEHRHRIRIYRTFHVQIYAVY